jgi:Ca-activated chloride channel homolog
MKRTFGLRYVVLALVYGAIGIATFGLNACASDEASTVGAGNSEGCPPGADPAACTGDSAAAAGSGGKGTIGLPGPPELDDGAGAAGLESFPADKEDDMLMPDPNPIPAACDSPNKNPKVLYMSADDSNSMGSPGHVREIINIGFEPSPYRIRTYEFLNYYKIAYDPPPTGELSIIPQMAPTMDPLVADFQIGIRSFDTNGAHRPMNFTFLVDNSFSMKGPGMMRARYAVRALASKFVPGDIVSFISTDSSDPKMDGVVISEPNDPDLLTVIDNLNTAGKTDLKTSLDAAFQLAKKHRQDDRMNRVIFISDGGVDVGITDIDLIAERSRDGQSEGIYFVGIGTGPALSYNDPLMDALTDAGRGAYVYIDSDDEAKHLLADRFSETMDIAARSVQVELTLPWFFNAEGISTEAPLAANPVEAQHLAPDDAMVYFLKTTACDPAIYKREDPVKIRVFWRTREGYKPRVTEMEVKLNELFNGDPFRMAKGRSIVAYAEALKGCGFDKQGAYLCDNETERKKATKAKLIEARTLIEETLKMEPGDLELLAITKIINNHTLLQ